MRIREAWKTSWPSLALAIILCYPVMVVKWLPFGGGTRYLSVLAAPVCLILLLQMPRGDVPQLLRAAWRWTRPLLPFALAWSAAQLWHHHDPADHNPITHVLWGALLYTGGRRVGVTYRQLAVVAGIACAVYCAVGVYEVFVLHRVRAWGGTYENRFGQYAVWMVALVALHFFSETSGERNKRAVGYLLLSVSLGMLAAILSGSRGALLGLVALSVIAAFRLMRWQIGLLVGGGAVSLVAASLLFAPLGRRAAAAVDQLVGYFTESQFSPTSIGLRLELIRIAAIMLVEHPLFGPGATSLDVLYRQNPILGVPLQKMLDLPGFHSDFGQMIGLGGGLLLTGWLVSCVWLLRVAQEDAFRQSFVVLAIIFGLSEIFFANNLGFGLLVASWALYSAAADNRKECHEGDQKIPVQAG